MMWHLSEMLVITSTVSPSRLRCGVSQPQISDSVIWGYGDATSSRSMASVGIYYQTSYQSFSERTHFHNPASRRTQRVAMRGAGGLPHISAVLGENPFP
ncbi:MAG: hypothetical protein MJZ52_04285 [Bacteroidales bacterium]|nr:hypothetical protein [Bacteroidales bacterium]